MTTQEALTTITEQVERMFPEGPLANPQTRLYARAYKSGARRLASLLEPSGIDEAALVQAEEEPFGFAQDGREQTERIEAAGHVSDEEDDGDAD